MSDEPTLSPSAFGMAFRAFLEESVKGTEVEDPPFVAAALFAAEGEGELVVTDRHMAEALEELLVAGGTLTMRLLGGEAPPPDTPSPDWFEDDGPQDKSTR